MITMDWTENSSSVNGYKIFTHFGKRESRGVALYVKENIKARLLDCTIPSIESVFIKISINKNETIVCGVVFR